MLELDKLPSLARLMGNDEENIDPIFGVDESKFSIFDASPTLRSMKQEQDFNKDTSYSSKEPYNTSMILTQELFPLSLIHKLKYMALLWILRQNKKRQKKELLQN